jgi:hypothetical protein
MRQTLDPTEKVRAMHRAKEYGAPNPNPPPELAQFAFLVGEWRCDVRVKGDDGAWQPYEATWIGRYILDGRAIADEYRMWNGAGELIVHGMNFRTYNADKKAWIMRWLHATGAFWLELGPESLGGVRVGPDTITFKYVDLAAPDAIDRVTFSNIEKSHFTWTGERSHDRGRTWTVFIVLEAHRTA